MGQQCLTAAYIHFCNGILFVRCEKQQSEDTVVAVFKAHVMLLFFYSGYIIENNRNMGSEVFRKWFVAQQRSVV